MKDGIHPNYRLVVFEDASCGFRFLTRSTINTPKTIKWEDGNEYPHVTIDISSESHPFYTGKARMIDSAGRVDKFRKKFGRAYAAVNAGKSDDSAAEAPAEAKADDAKADDKPAESGE